MQRKIFFLTFFYYFPLVFPSGSVEEFLKRNNLYMIVLSMENVWDYTSCRPFELSKGEFQLLSMALFSVALIISTL